jgi:hypothetical protein
MGFARIHSTSPLHGTACIVATSLRCGILTRAESSNAWIHMIQYTRMPTFNVKEPKNSRQYDPIHEFKYAYEFDTCVIAFAGMFLLLPTRTQCTKSSPNSPQRGTHSYFHGQIAVSSTMSGSLKCACAWHSWTASRRVLVLVFRKQRHRTALHCKF